MNGNLNRRWAYVGVAAVAFWVLGILLNNAGGGLSEKASDAATLAWIRDNDTTILFGGWSFMTGCLCFIWFAGILRERLAAAEGGTTFATIAFAGALATAIFGMGSPAGDLASAISKDNISPATAGALHHLSDAFFVGAELSAIVLLAAVGILTLRTRVLPRWWGIVGLLLAVVLFIGPIGWAALIFGLPVWTLVTSLLVARSPRRGAVAAQAPAVA
ncbi:MAG: hypothetical protein QOE36_2101 [Gaiellaceae bacterium]|jgi:hypothetical protein|nr:hypothetical protein [Gaiellaceae bacterium]